MHITLGVNRVIKPPIRDRGNSHAVFEGPASVLLQRFQSHETAVTPTPDSHALWVDIRLLRPYLCRLDLIVRFVVSKSATDYTSSFSANESSASTVDGNNNVIEIGSNVGLEINDKPAVHGLRVRTTVKVEEYWIFSAWI